MGTIIILSDYFYQQMWPQAIVWDDVMSMIGKAKIVSPSQNTLFERSDWIARISIIRMKRLSYWNVYSQSTRDNWLVVSLPCVLLLIHWILWNWEKLFNVQFQ